jgi:hypothetical protein
VRLLGLLANRVRQVSMFFFEKKNQKTFAHWRASAGWARDSDSKVFCFFFSKKKS